MHTTVQTCARLCRFVHGCKGLCTAACTNLHNYVGQHVDGTGPSVIWWIRTQLCRLVHSCVDLCTAVCTTLHSCVHIHPMPRDPVPSTRCPSCAEMCCVRRLVNSCVHKSAQLWQRVESKGSRGIGCVHRCADLFTAVCTNLHN